MAYVYRHIRLDKNEPFYIGIGAHLKRAYEKTKRNKFWYNVVAKTEYNVEILFYDLQPRGLSVHMISPGFVATPATAKNDFAMPALISPEKAAQEILAGIQAGEFDIHFPKRFSRFLKFLRILPYPIYFWILRNFVKI